MIGTFRLLKEKKGVGMKEKRSESTESKKEKAVQMMTDKGLDGLIVFSRGTISILSPSYFHYFAGFRTLGPNNAARAWDRLASKEGKT
jgi:hypothetical protein